jgi:kumamolisin
MQSSELEGSARSYRIGDRVIGRANAHANIRVTVEVQPEKDALSEFVSGLVRQKPKDRKPLSREDYANTHGASVSDLQKVERWAINHGLNVVPDGVARATGSSRRARRTVELSGSIGAFSRIFGIQMYQFTGIHGPFRGYVGSLKIPSGMEGIIRNVLGVDTRAQGLPRSRSFPHSGGFRASGLQSFSADQVAKLYKFPTGVTGKGQTVALIELGGGYYRSDLKKYFNQLGIPMPELSNFPVTRFNSPSGNPNNSADIEVNLDIQVLGAVAPGAKIVVYFTHASSRAFLRAINAAIHDNVNKPSIISISWGKAEGAWVEADMKSFDTAFQAATAMGITVCCAAGDGGSNDATPPNYTANVDFPGSSWFVTSCGGTRLLSQDRKTVSREVVWNDGPQGGGTGGGISQFFSVPPYQSSVALPPSVIPGAAPGRAVPDIAGNADPSTGYNIWIDGVEVPVGGTSAVAPLWAGLVALMNEGLQTQVGFLNNALYAQVAAKPGALRQVTQGNNDLSGLVGAYKAGPGWNACTGLGTPADANLIMDAFR